MLMDLIALIFLLFFKVIYNNFYNFEQNLLV